MHLRMRPFFHISFGYERPSNWHHEPADDNLSRHFCRYPHHWRYDALGSFLIELRSPSASTSKQTMASAAARVFAIAELVEQVLLYIEDGQRLFGLQRVSRSFDMTINGSTGLLRKMRICQKTLSHEHYIGKLVAVNPYLIGLSFGPNGVHDLSYQGAGRMEQSPGIGVHFNFVDVSTLHKGKYRGLTGAAKLRRRRKCWDGSWRSMMISTIAQPVLVCVHVHVRFKLDCLKYVEQRVFEAGDGTLEDLVVLFEEIKCRTGNDHFAHSLTWYGKSPS